MVKFEDNLHNITLRKAKTNSFNGNGLLLLKQLENLSDENVVVLGKNPYFQYFWIKLISTALPCHITDLVYFRNRIGKKRFGKFIFKHSIEIHSNENLNESQVIADTTIQESNLTYQQMVN